MRYIAISADLVRRIHDDDALIQVVGEYSRRFSKHGGFADARTAHHEHTLARLNEVPDDRDRAEYGSTYATGKADDPVRSIADCRNSVECALDPSAIIVTKEPDAMNDVLEIFGNDRIARENHFTFRESTFRLAAQVHYHLEKLFSSLDLEKWLRDTRRQDIEKSVKVVRDDATA